MNYNSKAIEGANVTFPVFNAERHYMVPFYQRTGLPSHLRHWQPTVDAMLKDVDSDGPIFMMVDQKLCVPGQPHRRGGVHIDGYWCGPTDTAINHDNAMGWGPNPGWQPRSFNAMDDDHHKMKPKPQFGWDSEPKKQYEWGNTPPTHGSKLSGPTQDWSQASLEDPEAIILASNYSSCRGYVGPWSGELGYKGACEHIDISGMESFMLKPNTVYTGNVAFLHESTPLDRVVERTIVRLNVRGWEPVWH